MIAARHLTQKRLSKRSNHLSDLAPVGTACARYLQLTICALALPEGLLDSHVMSSAWQMNVFFHSMGPLRGKLPKALHVGAMLDPFLHMATKLY